MITRQTIRREKAKKSPPLYTYILLSLIFVVVNLITLGNLVPWIDEVMILDTSCNAAVHGTWETTAWCRVARQSPFSTCPPLYQLLATAWIWLFGGSLLAVRGLNLLIVFLLGGVFLRLLKRHGLTPNTMDGCPVCPITVGHQRNGMDVSQRTSRYAMRLDAHCHGTGR